MLFKLPLLLIVKAYFSFSVRIHTELQSIEQYKQGCSGGIKHHRGGGAHVHLLSILLRTLEKHQGPRKRLCKALLQKDSTILWLPFYVSQFYILKN